VDGSAPIVTLEILKADWVSWSEEDQMDFCDQFDCLSYVDSDYAPEKPDLPAMIRFVVERGSQNVLNAISHPALRYLRRDEVFELMVNALNRCPIGHGSNVLQVIALTENRTAEQVLRERLEADWGHATFGDDVPRSALNSVASEAKTCICLLLRYFAAPPTEFEAKVRQLSTHPCARNREICRRHLSKYFPWMTSEELPPSPDRKGQGCDRINKTGGLPPEDRPT
jgi:hypothetical protein